MEEAETNLVEEVAKSTGQPIFSLKKVSEDNYCNFDNASFQDGLIIKVGDLTNAWLQGPCGGYYTLMNAITADGEEITVKFYAATIFRRMREIKDNVAQRTLLQHTGNYLDYRKNSLTLESFWNSIKGKKIKVKKVKDFKTNVFDKNTRIHTGDIVPAEKQADATQWNFDIE